MEGITCELQFLGTGHATVPGCFNTCFVLRAGTDRLSVDAGGGNGILRQFRRAGLSFGDLTAGGFAENIVPDEYFLSPIN